MLVAAALAGCGTAERSARVGRDQLGEGRRVFVDAGCGGCHTLAVAGTHGTVGPNFDTSEELDAVQIRRQLRLGAGGMPSYRGRLTPRQEAAVSRFLATALHRRRR